MRKKAALYEEPWTGLRLTGQDYAAKYGYANEAEVEEALHGRRTTVPDEHQDSSGI